MKDPAMYDNCALAVVGLGYVGLPLAVEFGRHRKVIGFDISSERIAELQTGFDATLEVSTEELGSAVNLDFSSDPSDLENASIFIVTVPTPVDDSNRPNLAPLIAASETVGASLKTDDIVIYESTVYPGATEEVCVPALEKSSGLTFNEDFYCGYSPERINPGDKAHRLPDIVKVTSGSTPAVARIVDDLYGEIINAGTHMSESIQVAEAAKVIENTQRDLNIALVNELSIIFSRLGIDTQDVLRAAGTKWNFLSFQPGLVGGHCIGVDPYYLTYKAEATGYHPEVILAGRRINDSMGERVVSRLVKRMIQTGIPILGSRTLVLGFAFKENCPDLRNTRVIDVVECLESYGVEVDVHDPWVSATSAKAEYGIDLVEPHLGQYDAILLAVPHHEFVAGGASAIREYGKPDCVVFDLKSVFPREDSDLRL